MPENRDVKSIALQRVQDALNQGYRLISRYSTSEERALFDLDSTIIDHALVKGPGESPFKKGKNLIVVDSSIRARYALWECDNLEVYLSRFYQSDRAPLWYTKNFLLDSCRMESPKSLRMCSGMTVRDSSLKGIESLWQIDSFDIDGFDLVSYYPFLECNHGKIRNLRMKGKYSFQHCSDIEIYDSELDTKDAFWHSRNIRVENSIVKGEYVGWYAEGLTFVNCRIIGTQPFVESKRLKFIDCTFDSSCDRAFEGSEVTLINTPEPDIYKTKKVSIETR